jgi:crossover junction endodeoxyribonuclease RusA
MSNTPLSLAFEVVGTPQPQGSAKAFIPKGWKRAVITSDNTKVKPWRQEIAGVVRAEMAEHGMEMSLGPIGVTATFYFDRPASLPKRVTFKLTKPDADKTARALLDALTGIVFKDDAQVVDLAVFKRFGSPARVEAIVSEINQAAVAEGRTA